MENNMHNYKALIEQNKVLKTIPAKSLVPFGRRDSKTVSKYAPGAILIEDLVKQLKNTELPIASEIEYDPTVSGLAATDVQAAIDEIVTLISSGPGYIEYLVLLSQTGISAPTASILNNTLGVVPVLSYDAVGNFRLTAVGLFPDATKVEVDIQSIDITTTTMTNNVFSVFSAARISADDIVIRSGNISQEATINALTLAGAANTDVYANDKLNNTRFLVRVWN